MGSPEEANLSGEREVLLDRIANEMLLVALGLARFKSELVAVARRLTFLRVHYRCSCVFLGLGSPRRTVVDIYYILTSQLIFPLAERFRFE